MQASGLRAHGVALDRAISVDLVLAAVRFYWRCTSWNKFYSSVFQRWQAGWGQDLPGDPCFSQNFMHSFLLGLLAGGGLAARKAQSPCSERGKGSRKEDLPRVDEEGGGGMVTSAWGETCASRGSSEGLHRFCAVARQRGLYTSPPLFAQDEKIMPVSPTSQANSRTGNKRWI